jgi:hypothetical protein
MAPFRILCAAALLPLVLAGCQDGDVSRTFGLNRDAPDEFQVTTQVPLSMPPDFTLRPPRAGAPRPQELTPRQGAEIAMAPQSPGRRHCSLPPGPTRRPISATRSTPTRRWRPPTAPSPTI